MKSRCWQEVPRRRPAEKVRKDSWGSLGRGWSGRSTGWE